MAEIGICCNYATCFTNLTHFPKQDAQVAFIYLVTTLSTPYNCALPWFSHITTAMVGKHPWTTACVRMCRRCVTVAYSQMSLGLLPCRAVRTYLWPFSTLAPHTFIYTSISAPIITPTANFRHTEQVLSWNLLDAWNALPCEGALGAPSRVHSTLAYPLICLMLYRDCLVICLLKKMSALLREMWDAW